MTNRLLLLAVAALCLIHAEAWTEGNGVLWRRMPSGNPRDGAVIRQPVCPSGLENSNAVAIRDGIPQLQRIKKPNAAGVRQASLLPRKPSASFLGRPQPGGKDANRKS